MSLSDILSAATKARLRNPTGDDNVSLPELPDHRPRVVMAHCGGGGSCPTLYDLGGNTGVIFQGYPLSTRDKIAACTTDPEKAVMLPAEFFERVLNWALSNFIPADQLYDHDFEKWGPSSLRYHYWHGGAVVVCGSPVKGVLEEMLDLPNGEIAIQLSALSFIKILRDALVQQVRENHP